MCQLDLSVLIRKKVGLCPLQYTEAPRLKAGCVFSRTNPAAASFNANHPNAWIPEKRVEKTDGVTSATNTRHQQIGQSLFLLENLAARLFADNPVQIPNHHRVGVRAIGCSEQIMCRPDIRDPITHRFVDRLL